MKTLSKLCLPFIITILALCNVTFTYAQRGERGGHSDKNINPGGGQGHSNGTFNQGSNSNNRTAPIYREPSPVNRNTGSGDRTITRDFDRTPPVRVNNNGEQNGVKHINPTPTPPTQITTNNDGIRKNPRINPVTTPPTTSGDIIKKQHPGGINPTPTPLTGGGNNIIQPTPAVNPNPTPVTGGVKNIIHPNPAINPSPIHINPVGSGGRINPLPISGSGASSQNRIAPRPVAHYDYDNRRDFRGYGDRRHIWYSGYNCYRYRPNYWINIYYGGYPYYYWDGYYYSYWNGYYRPMYPPFGISVHYLPYGYYPVYMGMDMYYYYEGIYYRHYNDNYEVVDPPLGAKVPNLPKHAKAVNVNGEKFYELNGTYYKEVLNVKNEVLYEVVGKNGEIYNTENVTNTTNLAPAALKVGDIVSQLPANCKTVTINGEKLYVSPDDVYYQEQVDASNKVNYKVVGGSQ